MARYKKKTKSLDELENEGKFKQEPEKVLKKIKKSVEEGDKTKLPPTTISNLAEQGMSDAELAISGKKFGSYDEIEGQLGMDRSDAQGWADAHPELLEGDLKDEVENIKKVVEEGKAKDAAKTAEEVKEALKEPAGKVINIDEGTLVNATEDEKQEAVKQIAKINNKNMAKTVTFKNPKSYTLENSKDTETAVSNLLKDNADKTFTRAEITGILSTANLSPRAKELTKGGVKTGKGKPRYVKNVAWAIQRLSKNGSIQKVGKNAYSFDPNAKPVVTPTITVHKPYQMHRKPRAAKQPATPNITIKAANVQMEATATQPAAMQPSVEVREIQPSAQPGNPNPPPVVEHVVKAPQSSAAPQMQRNMDLNNVMITKEVPYIKNSNIDDIIDAHFADPSNQPLLFVGPAGVGKTIAVEAYAKSKKIPFIRVQATPETSDDQLLGHSTYTPSRGVEFHYGQLPRAVSIANKYGSAILMIDEMNLLKAEYQTNLNPLTDYNKAIIVNETGEKFELEPGKKLLVIGTMNPAGYAGTNSLQEAVRNRFTEVIVDYPSLPVERKILTSKTGVTDDELITKLVTASTMTRNNKQGHLEISTRTLENTLRNYRAYMTEFTDHDKALSKAITNSILNKYYEDPEYMDEVKRKFNDTLKGFKGFKGI